MIRFGILTGIVLFLVFVLLPESGPNCPGMDPAWLGWCE